MPANANVFIKYGPYKAVGVVQHRDSRLRGLQAVLTKYGHKVKFEPIEDWNRVEITVNGETVFTCDIRDLDYGGDGELDQLCLEAKEKVDKAY